MLCGLEGKLRRDKGRRSPPPQGLNSRLLCVDKQPFWLIAVGAVYRHNAVDELVFRAARVVSRSYKHRTRSRRLAALRNFVQDLNQLFEIGAAKELSHRLSDDVTLSQQHCIAGIDSMNREVLDVDDHHEVREDIKQHRKMQRM